jgi:hypothetical protein
MGFTSAGLGSGGQTTFYQVSYDDTFSATDGLYRASLLMGACDGDFQLMQGWFSGVNFKFSFPIYVQIANATGGAHWDSSGPTVTINPGTGTSVDFIRYLLVAEVTEMFMDSQSLGWFRDSDEGSMGEGLSRFLSYQFNIREPLPEHYSGFDVVHKWLNFPGRPDYVDNCPDDNNPDEKTGCTAGFLHYLCYQLGFSENEIIAVGGTYDGFIAIGAANLGQIYTNLTGKNDGWQSFIDLVTTYYPPPGIPRTARTGHRELRRGHAC